jgi:hypothetical protein
MKLGYLDKNIKAANLLEITRGKGYEYTNITEDEKIPSSATSVAVHGVLRGNGGVIKQAMEKGIDWLYVDNGYLNTYKRVVMNATAPTTKREGRRFEHNTQFKPWRGGGGKHIILLPPSPPYMETFGGSCREFLNHCAHNINLYTDRDVIVRAKPAKGRKAKDWDEQLKDAYCVVTWGSNLALDAMIKGVPTVSLGWCPASFASKRFEDFERMAMVDEPDRQGIVDNLTWSSFEKNELNICYNMIMEKYNA